MWAVMRKDSRVCGMRKSDTISISDFAINSRSTIDDKSILELSPKESANDLLGLDVIAWITHNLGIYKLTWGDVNLFIIQVIVIPSWQGEGDDPCLRINCISIKGAGGFIELGPYVSRRTRRGNQPFHGSREQQN